MKIANTWIFVSVMFAGLIHSPAPLQAQPVKTPISVEGDDRPWNQGVSIESRRAARDLFLEGNRLFDVPLFAPAVAQYTAALKKWKHPAIHFNLAFALLNLGKEVEARENLEQALRHGEEPLGTGPFQEARKQLMEVEHQLGRIFVICRTRGAEVTVDGVALFTGPGNHRVWVTANTHEITAKKASYLSETRRLEVSAGAVQDIELKLITLEEATDASRRWKAWKPAAVAVAGGAIVAAGGVLHVLSSRNFNAYDEGFLRLTCATSLNEQTPPGCLTEQVPKKIRDRLILARREQRIAVGSYIVGGVSLAAGIALLYLNRPHLTEQASMGAHSGSVTIAPVISAEVFGVAVNVNR